MFTTFCLTTTVSFGDPYTVLDPGIYGSNLYITSVTLRNATNSAPFTFAIAMTPSDFDPSQVVFGGPNGLWPSPSGPTGSKFYVYFSTPGSGGTGQSVSEGSKLYINWVSSGQTPEDSIVFDIQGYYFA